MERKDVKWEEIREKERELFNLEEQYYQQKKELDDKALDLNERNANLEKLMSDEVDKMYQVLRKFSSWTLQYEEKFARVLKKRFLICYSSMMKFNKMVQSEWDKVRYFKSFLYHLSEKL